MSFTLDDDEYGPDDLSAQPTVAPSVTLSAKGTNDLSLIDVSVSPLNLPAPVLAGAPSASFNIDEFLGSTAAIPSYPPRTVAGATGEDSFSIDEFLAGTPSPFVSAPAPRPTPTAADSISAPLPVAPATAPPDDDFMSWLDNATKDSPISEPPAQTPVGVPVGVPAGTDALFEETSPMSAASSSSSLPPVAPYIINTGKPQKKVKYESDLLKVITSGFPDVLKLQGLIAGGGYIPKELRGQVWCLLLSGTCSEDQEADFWQSTGLELPNHTAVVSDCEAVIEKSRRRGLALSAANFEQMKRDMIDILVLFCVRRTIPYKSLYCDLLAPMLVSAKPLSRSLASSCFYSLCSEFIPVINLPVILQERTSNKLHELFRLLMLYHYPKLVSHLDRVLKGWEKRTSSISAAMAIKFDAAVRDRLELDELERDFGLSLPGSDAESASAASTAKVTLETEQGLGRIPENWLYCIFGAAVPLDLSCWIWDWVLSTGDKFAGVYVTVALFGLYADALRTMTDSQIFEWVEQIAMGTADRWFSKLPINYPGDSSHEVVPNLTWESFVRGWIHAAEALRHATPASFQVSLNSVEKWGSEPPVTGTLQLTGLDSSYSDNMLGQDRTTNKLEVTSNIPTASHGGGSSQIIERLKRLSVQMQKPPETGATDGIRGRFSWALSSGINTTDGGSSSTTRGGGLPGHANPELSSRCLWANVEEVVPCLCSSSKQRQAIPAEKKVIVSFKSGAQWGATDDGPIVAEPNRSTQGVGSNSRSNSITSVDSGEGSVSTVLDRGGEGFVIPHISAEKEHPLFFGIDCRTAENEINMGKFPKAYSLDPADLKDSYMISTILRTLEPMADQFHFCIIGVGEDFFVHRAAVLASKVGKGKGLVEAPTVEALKSEYFHGVAAVIDFFLKRDFKHVSFLEGGFTSAIRYLMKDESPYSINTALVDVEPDTIDAVYGQGTASAHLNIRRGLSGSIGCTGAATNSTSSATSGAAAFLSSLAKADIFASGDNDGDVVEVAAPQSKPIASGTSGILSFMSKKSTGANPGPVVDQMSATISGPSDGVAGSKSAPPPSGEKLGELKSKMNLFGSNTLASLRRVSQSVGSGANNTGNVGISSGVTVDDSPKGGASTPKTEKPLQRSSSAFVIDDDEDGDDGNMANETPTSQMLETPKNSFITRVGGVIRSSGGGSLVDVSVSSSNAGSVARLQGGGLIDVDPDKIGISKTEAEKAQALAMHKLAGVVKGDQITINREALPGALLFPARKIKLVPVPKFSEQVEASGETNLNEEVEMKEELFHRYIVVTKERVIVLDSGGGGVGSLSTVKSNHHLTEFVKLTFKKKDPELLTLFVASSMPMPDNDADVDALDEKQRGGGYPVIEPKQKQYRVAKRDELVDILQKYMKRFR